MRIPHHDDRPASLPPASDQGLPPEHRLSSQHAGAGLLPARVAGSPALGGGLHASGLPRLSGLRGQRHTTHPALDFDRRDDIAGGLQLLDGDVGAFPGRRQLLSQAGLRPGHRAPSPVGTGQLPRHHSVYPDAAGGTDRRRAGPGSFLVDLSGRGNGHPLPGAVRLFHSQGVSDRTDQLGGHGASPGHERLPAAPGGQAGKRPLSPTGEASVPCRWSLRGAFAKDRLHPASRYQRPCRTGGSARRVHPPELLAGRLHALGLPAVLRPEPGRS